MNRARSCDDGRGIRRSALRFARKRVDMRPLVLSSRGRWKRRTLVLALRAPRRPRTICCIPRDKSRVRSRVRQPDRWLVCFLRWRNSLQSYQRCYTWDKLARSSCPPSFTGCAPAPLPTIRSAWARCKAQKYTPIGALVLRLTSLDPIRPRENSRPRPANCKDPLGPPGTKVLLI